ncbi:hypothetical protein LINPERPRIM_LOCUS18986, partial [Linum perenne]
DTLRVVTYKFPEELSSVFRSLFFSSFKASSVRVSGVRLTDICIFRSKQQSWRKKKIKVELKEKLADMHVMMDPHCHLCDQMQDTPPRWKVNSVSIDL